MLFLEGNVEFGAGEGVGKGGLFYFAEQIFVVGLLDALSIGLLERGVVFMEIPENLHPFRLPCIKSRILLALYSRHKASDGLVTHHRFLVLLLLFSVHIHVCHNFTSRTIF